MIAGYRTGSAKNRHTKHKEHPYFTTKTYLSARDEASGRSAGQCRFGPDSGARHPRPTVHASPPRFSTPPTRTSDYHPTLDPGTAAKYSDTQTLDYGENATLSPRNYVVTASRSKFCGGLQRWAYVLRLHVRRPCHHGDYSCQKHHKHRAPQTRQAGTTPAKTHNTVQIYHPTWLIGLWRAPQPFVGSSYSPGPCFICRRLESAPNREKETWDWVWEDPALLEDEIFVAENTV
ncbi:hypothetical protein Bbelb_015060 [Branchiostoma belcheri]|nr:hypothetical protein Bbelb_015060 [Branchiostoma belcheri]